MMVEEVFDMFPQAKELVGPNSDRVDYMSSKRHEQ